MVHTQVFDKAGERNARMRFEKLAHAAFGQFEMFRHRAKRQIRIAEMRFTEGTYLRGQLVVLLFEGIFGE